MIKTPFGNVLQSSPAKKPIGRDEEIAKVAVMTVSRGNVNLQLGRYITKTQKERLRSEMMEYKIKAKI